jgi:hypothetical protein
VSNTSSDISIQSGFSIVSHSGNMATSVMENLNKENRYEAWEAEQAAMLELILRENNIEFKIVEHLTKTNRKEVHFYVDKRDDNFINKAKQEIFEKINENRDGIKRQYQFLITKYTRSLT